MEQTETLEQLQARHRKEAKELQNRITQKKRQATKKTRKGVNDECANMERDLKDKQAEELAALRGDTVDDTPDSESEDEQSKDEVDGIIEKLEGAAISQPSPPPTDETSGPKPKRNRQKERLARRAAEAEAEALKAEEEAVKQPNWKKQERTAMEAAFKKHSLREREIRADGHCLYSSIADQLTTHGIDIGALNEAEKTESFWYKPVRRKAAMYILDHRDEFEGFLEEPVISYTSKIERTAEWGGHLELVALAKSYGVEINVLQDGKIDKIEPGEEAEGERKSIWLAYYHHGYGLGEHYNSLRKVDKEAIEKKDEPEA